MQCVNISKDEPTEVNLSINDIINDLTEKNGIYGAININLKIGAPIIKNKGILSVYTDESYNDNIIATYINDIYGSNSEILSKEELMSEISVYKFKNKSELLEWLQKDD